MNPKTKKILIICSLVLDLLITIGLFVMSIVLLVNLPDNKYAIDPNTFIGWFLQDPIRILLIIVIPLVALLIINVFMFYKYMKSGDSKAKDTITLDDLTDEQKEALKKKIEEELLNSNKK